MTYNCNLMI